MKTQLSMCLAGVVMSMSVAAQQNADDNIRFVGDKAFAGFCKAAVLDDVRVLRANLARNVGVIGGSERDVLRQVIANPGVTCNGKSLVEFSELRNAQEVRKYLNSRS